MTSEPTKRSETQTDIPTYYERKLSWMLGRMFLDSIAWALALVVAFMLRYSVLLNQRSVLDVIDAQALAITLRWRLSYKWALACGIRCTRRAMSTAHLKRSF